MLPGNGQCLNGTGKPQVPNLVNAIPTDDKRGSWEPLRSHSPESLYNVSPVCSHTHAGVSYICDRKPSLRRRTIQYSALLVAVPLALMTWATLWQGGFPQSYTDILKLEIDLPQHQWEDTQLTAEGKLVQVQHNGELKFVDWGRDAGEGYIRFPDHLWGQGFNSIFQEGILYAQLAHLANRSYIFEDYVWSQTTLPYTLRNAALRLSRTPLNALISRFMAGGDVSTSPYSKKPSHNSISARYYEYICPSTLSERYRVTLSANDAPHFADGLSQMAWWVNRVKEVGKGKRCVDIQESGIRGTVGAQGKRVFDNQFFGSKNRIGQLVPQLIKSPVLQRFSWSPLVVDVVERTTHALGTKSPETSIDSTGTRNTIQGLLAIDLTWGDCAKPSQLNRGFTGFNNADAMMDKLNVSEALGENGGNPGQQQPLSTTRARRERRRKAREERAGNDDKRLEPRWWYWAGRAGQRISTNGEVGGTSTQLSASKSKSKYTSSTVVRPPYAKGPPASTTRNFIHIPTPVATGVRIQKEEFGFGRQGGAGLQDVMAALDSSSPALEEQQNSKSTKSKPMIDGPQRWMWWGGGSKQKASTLATETTLQSDDEGGGNQLAFEMVELESRFFDEEAVESSSPEGRAEVDGYHLKRCNPSTDQLVQRAREVSVDWSRASEHTPLTKVVLISDDLSAQHLELSSALEKEGFEILDADQRVRKGLGRIEDVAVAVDMALAARAEDFLGNGFSPLSGNVALLRMARGYEGEANRLV